MPKVRDWYDDDEDGEIERFQKIQHPHKDEFNKNKSKKLNKPARNPRPEKDS